MSIKKTFSPSDVDLSGWTLKSNKTIKEKGVNNGKTYSVYTKAVHLNGFWRTAKFLYLISIVFFSGGTLLLCSKKPSKLWRQIKTGDEIIKQKVLDPIKEKIESLKTSENISTQENNTINTTNNNNALQKEQANNRDNQTQEENTASVSIDTIANKTVSLQKEQANNSDNQTQEENRSSVPIDTIANKIVSLKKENMSPNNFSIGIILDKTSSIENTKQRISELEESASVESEERSEERSEAKVQAIQNPINYGIIPVGKGRTCSPVLLKSLPDPMPQLPSVQSMPICEDLNQSAEIFVTGLDGNSVKKNRVLGAKLITWHKRSLIDIKYHTAMNDNDVLKLEKRIKDRIDLLNDSFNFQIRLTANQGMPHYQKITIRDINLPWDKSSLQFILCSNIEITQITFGTLLNLNDKQKQVVINRLLDIELKDEPLSNAPLNELKLAEFKNISTDVLDDLISQLPANAVNLLSEKQWLNLNILRLKKDRFKLLFCRNEKMNLLESLKFEQCVKRLGSLDPASLEFLEVKKIQAIDFGNKNVISKRLFESIVKMDYFPGEDRGRKVLRNMLPKQFMDALARGLFDSVTAENIPDEIFKQIDRSKIDASILEKIDRFK